MHLVPNSTELNHTQVHNHLPARNAPRHPRLFQPLSEHRLTRRLGHSTPKGKMALAVATIGQKPQAMGQVIVRLLELLARTLQAPSPPQRRRRMQHPERTVGFVLEPPAHLAGPGMTLSC